MQVVVQLELMLILQQWYAKIVSYPVLLVFNLKIIVQAVEVDISTTIIFVHQVVRQVCTNLLYIVIIVLVNVLHVLVQPFVPLASLILWSRVQEYALMILIVQSGLMLIPQIWDVKIAHLVVHHVPIQHTVHHVIV
jgi:hypothetical protein